MIDGLADAITSLVTGVAEGVYRLARLIFRLEPTDKLPLWARLVAIMLIGGVTLLLIGLVLSILGYYLLVVAIFAAIAAIAGLLGLG
jgi:hypothetical protein